MSIATPATPYQDLILSHAKTPRRYGAAAAPSHTAVNPLCGDQVTFYLTAKAPVGVSFASQGCALCRASASILADVVAGMDQASATRLVRAFVRDFANDAAPRPEPRELAALRDMRRFATRIRCVLLPWEALDALLMEAR